MKHEIVMPQLSETVNEGVLVAWFVEEGAGVNAGELMAEVQVEKASAEVHAPAGGTVIKLCVAPGGVVAQGAVMAVIDEAGKPITAVEKALELPSRASTSFAEAVLASPAAKRLARELNVDLAGIAGSGPGGRIVEADVQLASQGSKAAATIKSVPVTHMRRTIGDRLRAWYSETVQVSIMSDADVTELSEALEQAGTGPERGPSLTAAVVRACALSLRNHARMAARWAGESLVLAESLDIGVAIALDDGLIVPVIRAADTKDLSTLSREIASLAERARALHLKPSEVEGGVFSVSNLGAFGVDAFTPALNPPQTAILGMGRAKPTPSVVDGAVRVRTRMVLSLTFDHRVVDGVPAAAFLQEVVSALQEPRARGLT